MTNHNNPLADEASIRSQIRSRYLADEHEIISELIDEAALSDALRVSISQRAAALVRTLRSESDPTLIEKFLAEYRLTTDEGVALMCLAETLLRVPDNTTVQALIDDKLGPGDWSAHLGHSKSPLINITTWGLMVAGRLITPFEELNLAEILRGLTKRLGDPMVRVVGEQAMAAMGRQFVLGRSIKEAVKRSSRKETKGYSYSYDMLGEAARTDADALRYFGTYAAAIDYLKNYCRSNDIGENPGISVKLSALHPRYEAAQHGRVINELVPRALALARQAKAANMGFNIDAEEADRLDVSLDVIEAMLHDPSLAGWDGFGVVVQAYGRRASQVLDWLYLLATKLDRKIMVRLVKGAYWDTEIKRAQILGLQSFPVFTRKACCDVSYIACAKKLLNMRDRIYPQFATHNAHSVSAILELAGGTSGYEFQRLHGMGESLHEAVKSESGTRCRIYAPVGKHRDLLSYLVRRLLENGANSSFVNQIVDTRIAPVDIAQDPFTLIASLGEAVASKLITPPSRLFGEYRRNAKGWDITDVSQLEHIESARQKWKQHQWYGGPVLASPAGTGEIKKVINPANPSDSVGEVQYASATDVEQAIRSAEEEFIHWSGLPASERAERIARVGGLYEQHAVELFALTTREAGKTLPDAIAEVREAVDFARYYAQQIYADANLKARGIISCISPWNFPLAIFSGQILASLAAGNVVLAKPAEQTSLIAVRAVELMHLAGIPTAALQLLPGTGADVGTALTSDQRIAGVCFTGSITTAQTINRAMAANMPASAPLIAETGGLNAMIVDSTALPEQVVKDVIDSAFQSAGQRCSSLRMLYLQEDIADKVLQMLNGAMDELQIGDPWEVTTDVGPVIDETAKARIWEHCDRHKRQGKILKQLTPPAQGRFVSPTVIQLSGIEELEEEIFGPVLHVATFAAEEIESVVDRINARGYGLTFGLHTRVNARVEALTQRIAAGNIYVNRNQIGAVVGSQPFGGEGLSGTGPKAGGPHYVRRFMIADSTPVTTNNRATTVSADDIARAIIEVDQIGELEAAVRNEELGKFFANFPAPLTDETTEMSGPTGELNLSYYAPRGIVICAGPDAASAKAQANVALSQDNKVIAVAPDIGSVLPAPTETSLALVSIDGVLRGESLTNLDGFAAIASDGDDELLSEYRQQLAGRDGPLLPLITESRCAEHFVLERHLCVDTTAAGGNASLVANSE